MVLKTRYYFLRPSLLDIFSFKRSAGENAIVLLRPNLTNMRKHNLGIIFLMLFGLLLTSLLSGQTTTGSVVRTNTVVVDDIDGPDGDMILYEVEGDEFELTISSFTHHFNFARVEVIDKSVGLFPLSINYFKPYDGDVRTDFFTGNLEDNKVYEIKITYLIYDAPQMVKRFQIVKLQIN
jgi:hypothetical protein